MSEPKVIYLGPACEAETGDGRTWAEDNPWPDCECGHRPVQYVLGETFDRVVAERDALQLRLNAADQRIDELTSIQVGGVDSEPPTYKPGLDAVRHIDNWDGERDVALTFAMLDADGKWADKETGDALLAYRGDKILRAWPLDCSDAPDMQVIGVPRNWLEDWALELVEAAQDGGQMSNQVEHLLEVHTKP